MFKEQQNQTKSAETLTKQGLGATKWFKVARKGLVYLSAVIYTGFVVNDFYKGGEDNFVHGIGNLSYAGISVLMTEGILSMIGSGM